VPRFLAIYAVRKTSERHLPECGQQNLGSELCVVLIEEKGARPHLGWRTTIQRNLGRFRRAWCAAIRGLRKVRSWWRNPSKALLTIG